MRGGAMPNPILRSCSAESDNFRVAASYIFRLGYCQIKQTRQHHTASNFTRRSTPPVGTADIPLKEGDNSPQKESSDVKYGSQSRPLRSAVRQHGEESSASAHVQCGHTPRALPADAHSDIVLSAEKLGKKNGSACSASESVVRHTNELDGILGILSQSAHGNGHTAFKVSF